jgi:hypothetical protein
MYKTDFVCTYKAFEELEDDEVNSDMLYRAQFLQVFGLTAYDDIAIHAGLEIIKAKAEDLPELKALILQHPYNVTFASSAPTNEPGINAHGATAAFDTLLTYLFAYPTMDVFHLCLIDALKTGSISQKNRDKLLHIYSTLEPNKI